MAKFPEKTKQSDLPSSEKSRDILNVYKKERKKRFPLFFKILIAVVVIIIISGLGIVTKALLSVNSVNEQTGEKVSLLEQIKNLIVNPEKTIKGEDADRINILLMGIGGQGHEGAYLTDTIILASLKPSNNEVALISIPRDLIVEIPGYYYRKINNAVTFGIKDDYPGGGEALLSSIVSKVFGVPIHYYARIDFTGFRKVVDDLGGIDVYVENSFTDYEYPDYSFGYQTVSFKQGWQHMNGERALQFVRSRHGTSGEGSDFARSQRQQKVLFAIKDKFLSLNTIINPKVIGNTLEDLEDNTKTNMQIWEMMRLAKLGGDINQDKIITRVLDTSSNGPLYSEITDEGAYVLMPKAGDYSELQYIARNIFASSFITRENANIEVQNGTNYTGLASKIADELTKLDYNVVKVSNAQNKDYEKTVIYDLTNGQKPYTLTSLKDKLDANLSSIIPPFLTSSVSEVNYETIKPESFSNLNLNKTSGDQEIDLVVVVGEDKYSPQKVTKSY